MSNVPYYIPPVPAYREHVFSVQVCESNRSIELMALFAHAIDAYRKDLSDVELKAATEWVAKVVLEAKPYE